MKTTKKLWVMMLAVGLIALSMDGLAQERNGRGRGQGKEWKNGGGHDHDKDWNDRDNRGGNDKYNDRSHNRNYRSYHRPPHWAPAHGYYKPRYVFYRDYNVYYDCFRGMYITFTGRNWVFSHQMPHRMGRVNFDRIYRIDLDYYDDDLPGYVQRRSRGYGRVGF
jgi:hypothetical protein